MKTIKKYSIFIDTKLDKTQNPSNFKVKINDHFLRNRILNTDRSNSEWFLSVKSLSMLNSFSNISYGINDEIILYVAKDLLKAELELGINDADYDIFTYRIPQGNPNVMDLQKQLNVFLLAYGLECNYNSYNSKYTFKNINGSIDNRKKYILFKNTYDVMGFNEKDVYYLNNTTHKEFESIRAVNLMADYLIKYSIQNGSDFGIKNYNYTNTINSQLFNQCNIFHLLHIDKLPYEILYYERSNENLVPIELYKNNINEFTINVSNQDNDSIENLSDYIMVLEFINIKKIDYNSKIYKVLLELYFWIAGYLKKFM